MSITVAILHPGRMGVTIAGQARLAGARVVWCPAGRSQASAERACAESLEPVPDMRELLSVSDIVLAVCPSAAAEAVASSVAAHGYAGLYVEANPVSPDKAQWIADLVSKQGARVVDACIVGDIIRGVNSIRLYVAGIESDIAMVSEVFAGTKVDVLPLGSGIGKASALKIVLAHFMRASRVISAITYALADSYGVSDELIVESTRLHSALAEPNFLASVAARAWRWASEAEEAADALKSVGLPDDFAVATAKILRLWDHRKDNFQLNFTEALESLRKG